MRHAAVVRELRPLGTPNNGRFDTSVDVIPQADWNLANLKIVVLAQDPVKGHIVGAASARYGPQSTGIGATQ